MRTLIVGIGNKLLQDDGVGLHIVETLEKTFQTGNIDYLIYDTDIFRLMNGYKDQDRIIIIDAINTDLKPGSIVSLREEGLFAYNAFSRSAHQISVVEALKLMKLTIPELEKAEIFFIGLQVEDILVNREISPVVMESAEIVLKLIKEILIDWKECPEQDLNLHGIAPTTP